MRILLVAAIAALTLAGSTTASTRPSVDVCDVVFTKQGKRVIASSFGARLAPLAQRPRCGSTWPAPISGCHYSAEHQTWIQWYWAPNTGAFPRPC